MTGDAAALLRDVATPALVLDRTRLIANCERGRQRARELGVLLRPHLKTAKSPDVGRLAMDPLLQGIAVSTLREAEYFAAAGFEDIQLAVCVTPDKLDRAFQLNGKVRRLGVFIDSLQTAQALAARPASDHGPLGIWIEVDSGEHRTGVPADGDLLVRIAQALSGAPAVRLEGVATHAGQTYDAGSVQEVCEIAELERMTLVAANAILAKAGFAGLQTSAGSTPALFHSRGADGLTEFRAGVYTLGDLFQAGMGNLGRDQIAVSVLAQVISRAADGSRFIIDAGGLALSKDRSTAGPHQTDFGYGLLMDAHGAPMGGLIVNDTAQEHGFVDMIPGVRLPEIGDRVRVLPNHACMTAAMYDRYLVLDGMGELDIWPRVNGW